MRWILFNGRRSNVVWSRSLSFQVYESENITPITTERWLWYGHFPGHVRRLTAWLSPDQLFPFLEWRRHFSFKINVNFSPFFLLRYQSVLCCCCGCVITYKILVFLWHRVSVSYRRGTDVMYRVSRDGKSVRVVTPSDNELGYRCFISSKSFVILT